jgi:hypothetical protein
MSIDQEESWMNLSGTEKELSAIGEPIIGRIFFATDERTLDQNDVDVLHGLAYYMKAYLARAEGPRLRPFTMGFIGWADYRGAAAYNMRLSQERADMVRAYFDEEFKGRGSTPHWRHHYNSISHGAGEGKARGSQIAQDRRVDITSNRKFKQIVEFEDRQIQGRVNDKTLSRIFQFRVRLGYQVGIPIFEVGVQVFFVEIRNPRNGRTIQLKFMGQGGGIGLPVGASLPSDWQQVDVGSFMEVDDFEGRGEITNASGGFDSSTIFGFYGPNDYGRTPEYQRLRDEPVKITTGGVDLSLGVGGATGYWERFQG